MTTQLYAAHPTTDVKLYRLVQAVLEWREEARAQGDWARADRLRRVLLASGIDVVDTPEGPRWSLAVQAGR